MRNDLRALRKQNDILHDRCNAHFVDNNSLKGTPMHMAHHMVKAYGISENCTYYAIAEPAFYGKIKQQQKKWGPLGPQWGPNGARMVPQWGSWGPMGPRGAGGETFYVANF